MGEIARLAKIWSTKKTYIFAELKDSTFKNFIWTNITFPSYVRHNEFMRRHIHADKIINFGMISKYLATGVNASFRCNCRSFLCRSVLNFMWNITWKKTCQLPSPVIHNPCDEVNSKLREKFTSSPLPGDRGSPWLSLCSSSSTGFPCTVTS